MTTQQHEEIPLNDLPCSLPHANTRLNRLWDAVERKMYECVSCRRPIYMKFMNKQHQSLVIRIWGVVGKRSYG